MTGGLVKGRRAGAVVPESGEKVQAFMPLDSWSAVYATASMSTRSSTAFLGGQTKWVAIQAASQSGRRAPNRASDEMASKSKVIKSKVIIMIRSPLPAGSRLCLMPPSSCLFPSNWARSNAPKSGFKPWSTTRTNALRRLIERPCISNRYSEPKSMAAYTCLGSASKARRAHTWRLRPSPLTKCTWNSGLSASTRPFRQSNMRMLSTSCRRRSPRP
jgi:hypothetical protein